MKMRVICILAVLSLVLSTGCSSDVSGDPTPGPDIADVDPSDVPDEGVGGDVEIHTGEVDAQPDEVDPCEDKCELGQILCTTDTRYKECAEADDGCLDFVGATIFCDANTVCICTALDLGGDDDWCDPGDDDPCVCVPDCDGKVCGPDGCGDLCGTCPVDEECTSDDWTCVPMDTCVNCVAACDATPPGPDCCLQGEQMCNGLKIIDCADAYPADQTCECWKWPDVAGEDCVDPLQICQDLPNGLGVCVCEFLLCDTGCCAGPEFTTCDPQGQCCIPYDCEATGKECGDDGCGGSCGGCPQGTYCDLGTGVCIPVGICQTECNVVGEKECSGSFAVKTCIDVPTGGAPCLVWDATLENCPAQYVCEDDGDDAECVCQPNCAGKNCGPDGCPGDGTCGECGASPNECGEDGTCECVCEDIWQPVCDEDNCETYPNWCEAACAGVTDFEQGPCDCGCTADCTEEEWNIGPVCGTDGVTYFSFCELKCSDDIYGNGCETILDCDDELAFIDVCELEPIWHPDCPANLNPVCGTNDLTYQNICSLTLFEVGYACVGECLEPAACPDAANICSPVCGMNDENQQISYMNAQVRDCLGGIPLYDSECCDGTSLGYDWVCTDNGGVLEAFQNEEIMQCIDPALQVLYAIPVDAYGDWQLAVCEDCGCDLSQTDETTWLCGSDFNTYLDQCALNCFVEPPFLSAVPLCDSGCGFMTDECPCPPGISGAAVATPTSSADTGARGVCGDDGATYGSVCDATYNGVMVVADAWCEECEGLCQGELYAPLCCKLDGQDTGATYPNACVVENCSNAYETGDCFTGECCLDDGDCDDGNPDTVDTCNVATFVCDHI